MKKKRLKKKPQPELTSKKHWIVYLLPSVFIISGIILFNKGENSYFHASGLAVMLFGFYQALKKANEKWHITDEHLIIEKGILPWFKKYDEIAIHDIYKTDADKHRLSRFFNLGHVNTRRRADDCRGFNCSFVANPDQFSKTLQLKVQQLPANRLNQVYELKERGAISEHEYNLIKLGHVTQQHLSKL